MGAIKTGVFAHPDEVFEAMRLAKDASTMPMISVYGKPPPNPWDRVGSFITEKAKAHGLPDPGKDEDGDAIHYGLLATGEFTKWDGAP